MVHTHEGIKLVTKLIKKNQTPLQLKIQTKHKSNTLKNTPS